MERSKSLTRKTQRIQVVLLDMYDDEAPHVLTPLNLSAAADLMDFSDNPVPGIKPPNPVGALTETIQQVTLIEDSGLRTALDAKEV